MKNSNDTAEHLVNHRITRIERLSRIDLDILEEVRRLVPQLRGQEPPRDTPEEAVVEEGLMPVAIDLAAPAADFQPVFEPLPAAPPAHPVPVDRGRWRIDADDRADPAQPWALGYCLECRLPTWSHDAVAAAKDMITCEDCYCRMLDDFYDHRRQQMRQITYRVINPFENQA